MLYINEDSTISFTVHQLEQGDLRLPSQYRLTLLICLSSGVNVCSVTKRTRSGIGSMSVCNRVGLLFEGGIHKDPATNRINKEEENKKLSVWVWQAGDRVTIRVCH